ENHFANGFDPVAFKKHVLGACEPYPLCPEGYGFLGLVRLIGVGPYLKTAELVRPAHQGHVILVYLRPLRGETLVYDNAKHFRRPCRNLTGKNVSGGTVE